MFWRFGGYANVSAIDTLLEKPDFTLENLLDEADLLHEIKQHNAKLIEYLREEDVLRRLLDYVVAPKLEPVAAPDAPPAGGDGAPADDARAKAAQFSVTRSRASSLATSEPEDEDEGEKRRNRYAYVASEVLASDTWSIYEALMETGALVREFWAFLKRDAPLDPLQASYFTKVNEALFEKKTEEMIEVLKSVPDAVPDLLRHVECPMIMDLLLKIIALDRTEGGHGIVEVSSMSLSAAAEPGVSLPHLEHRPPASLHYPAPMLTPPPSGSTPRTSSPSSSPASPPTATGSSRPPPATSSRPSSQSPPTPPRTSSSA